MLKRLTLLSILTLIGLLGSCYSFSQTSLPGHIKSLTVYPAENKTFQASMGDKLTQGIKDLFRREAPNIRQINENANAEFYITLNSYSNQPYNFSSNAQVNEYQVRISVDVMFKDLKKNTVLYEQKGLQAVGVYDVSSGESEEAHGQKRAMEEVQNLIINNALSGW